MLIATVRTYSDVTFPEDYGVIPCDDLSHAFIVAACAVERGAAKAEVHVHEDQEVFTITVRKTQ